MIKKFKNFFNKKQQIDIDYDELKLFVYDVMQPLSDINGIHVVKSNSSIKKNIEFFKIKFTINLIDPSDTNINELKSELKNCKSHLESENLDIQIQVIPFSAEDWINDSDLYVSKIDINDITNEFKKIRIIISFKK
jgi:hypothetical protein